MLDHYLLEGKNVVGPVDFDTYLAALKDKDEGKHGWRRVAWSGSDEGLHVSTVFLGLDHRYSHEGPPMIFETMIFGGEHDQWQERCSTWEQAEAMHKQACDLAGIPTELAAPNVGTQEEK